MSEAEYQAIWDKVIDYAMERHVTRLPQDVIAISLYPPGSGPQFRVNSALVTKREPGESWTYYEVRVDSADYPWLGARSPDRTSN